MTTSTLVVAAGTRDRKVAFPGGDLPGVMLARGVQRLLHRDRVRPGRRAVVAGDGAIGYAVARQLLDAGVEVAALADVSVAAAPDLPESSGVSPVASSAAMRQPLPESVRVLHLHAVKAAHGFGRLRGVTLTPADGHAARGAGRRDVRLECDTLCLALGEEPADELVAQFVAHGSHSLSGPRWRSEPAPDRPGAEMIAPSPAPGLWLAGSLAGPCSLATALAQGVSAGERAAQASSASA